MSFGLGIENCRTLIRFIFLKFSEETQGFHFQVSSSAVFIVGVKFFSVLGRRNFPLACGGGDLIGGVGSGSGTKAQQSRTSNWNGRGQKRVVEEAKKSEAVAEKSLTSNPFQSSILPPSSPFSVRLFVHGFFATFSLLFPRRRRENYLEWKDRKRVFQP